MNIPSQLELNLITFLTQMCNSGTKLSNSDYKVILNCNKFRLQKNVYLEMLLMNIQVVDGKCYLSREVRTKKSNSFPNSHMSDNFVD